jgi:hypothetical protein
MPANDNDPAAGPHGTDEETPGTPGNGLGMAVWLYMGFILGLALAIIGAGVLQAFDPVP